MPDLSPHREDVHDTQAEFARTVRHLARAISDGLYVPRFQDANDLLAAREQKGEATSVGNGEGKTEMERQCMRGLHLLRNAILRGTYDPKQDPGFQQLITTINQRLDGELEVNRGRKGGYRLH